MSSSFPPEPLNSSSQPPQPFPYSAQPPGPYGPYASPPQRLSLLALASAVLGGGGLLTCCCSFVSLPVSLLAVVLGHTALVFINRADSGLTGKVPAALGLVTGYLGLLLSVGFLAVGLLGDKSDVPAGPQPITASTLLDDVENKIRSDAQGIAHGNSDEAKALAQQYADLILELREELFTKGKGGISLSGGKFITYCELRPGQCAFVIHVPEYRRFDDDAKDSLAELAWLVAQRTTQGKLQTGDRLAVGLKGIVRYGSVMVGKVADPDDAESEPQKSSDDRADLLPFFEPVQPAVEAPAPRPAEEKASEAEPPQLRGGDSAAAGGDRAAASLEAVAERDDNGLEMKMVWCPPGQVHDGPGDERLRKPLCRVSGASDTHKRVLDRQIRSDSRAVGAGDDDEALVRKTVHREHWRGYGRPRLPSRLAVVGRCR